MPVIPFSELCPRGKLHDAADRLEGLAPGMVLATGQSISGKVTLLLALAARMAGDERCVVLLTDQADEFKAFHPLPANWTEAMVPRSETEWQRTLRSGFPQDALLVVSPLNRTNARAAAAAAGNRWIFATLDTLLAGLDTSFVLRDMGVAYDEFADNVRCVWSQFLVHALCDECAIDAAISASDREALLPANAQSLSIKAEAGCKACEWRGTQGRVAISDVTLLTDAVRPIAKAALVRGLTVAIDPELHVDAGERARELLEAGTIGISTYREAIQRNPLLRTKHAIELLKIQSRKLTSMFDTLVTSLWLDVNLLSAVADRTAAGVIVAEESGQIRFANTRARQALMAAGELSISDDRIVAGTTRARRSFADAMAKAVGVAPAATRLAVRLQGHETTNIYVAPLPAVRGFARDMRRLALIVVGGLPQDDLLPSQQDLRDYFDLTQAESKVALLLCAGHVAKDVARELQVSVPTVRSHVRALLAKTGTSRQAELVQLLACLPSTGQGKATG